MTESTHTLADLSKTLGAATEDELRAYFHGVDDAYPVAWGREIATPRIATDAPHIVGDALVFIDKASETQLASLAATSRDTLRLAVAAAMRAEALYRARKQSLKSSRNKQGEQVALSDQTVVTAIARETVLHGVLAKIACGTEPYASRVAAAYSKSEVPADVCVALDALIELGRQMLKDKNPGVVARRKTTRLSTAWLDEATTVSSTLAAAAERANAVRTVPEVTQPEVDLRDGWALMLLDEIVRAFDTAHDADATIPRISVYSLRNVLRPPAGKKAPAPAPASPSGDG